VPSWDGNNLLFWRYLIQTTALEPVRDFYWLYGFQWVFSNPVPWGLLAFYGWFLTFWAFLALGTYVSLARFFSGPSLIGRYAVLTAFWLTGFVTADVPFATRYVAPLGVVLLYAGIDGVRDGLTSWKRIVFVVALFELSLFELAQTAYALVPILFLAGAEFATSSARVRGIRRTWAWATTLTLGVPLVAATIVYWVTGTLGQTVSLYKQLTFASSGFAFPTQVDSWIHDPTTLDSLIFWAVPVTLLLGVVGFVARRDRLRLSYAVVTALGLLGFMMMQKQILRSHIAPQIWLPLLYGLAYWAVSDTVLSWSRRWVAVLGVTGVAAGLVLVSGGYRQGWNVLDAGPSRVRGTIHALVHDRATFARQADLQFAPTMFARFSEEGAVVQALNQVPAVKAGQPVWILGDESPITMMLGHSWPYYLNDMYDASPIDFQKKILERLAEHPPSRVVWNFAQRAMVFDAVPMPVRVPLLYRWSVENLVPDREVGTFAILRPRSENERIALTWWRRRIGMQLDLGRIPAATRLRGKPCDEVSECSSYLVVQLPDGTPRVPHEVINLTVDGLPFEIAFETGPESTYVIPLERVWFWAAGSGRRHVEKMSANGAKVTVVRRAANSDALY
jgi:hypothetical protein